MDSIDLNADLGESYGQWRLGDDEALLEVVTSANVACGFHAGDPATLVETCRAAVGGGVAIGAQVGYRDLAGFGRRFIDVGTRDLYADVLYQLGALDGIARAAGGRVAYVKPHGALYNTVVHHEAQAEAVARAVADYPADLTLLGLPGAVLLDAAAEHGIPVAREFFADRGYTAEGTLVDRRLAGAVLTDTDVVVRRIEQLVSAGTVTAADGSSVKVDCDSICLHGDTPGAVEMARAVRAALEAAGIAVGPFVR
ncbi:MAG TPA: 5-oxoprolinase subunit PxpA [Marmoricola sp.]